MEKINEKMKKVNETADDLITNYGYKDVTLLYRRCSSYYLIIETVPTGKRRFRVLSPPKFLPVWNKNKHYMYPEEFRKEVILWLCISKRKKMMNDISMMIIEFLGKKYNQIDLNVLGHKLSLYKCRARIKHLEYHGPN